MLLCFPKMTIAAIELERYTTEKMIALLKSYGINIARMIETMTAGEIQVRKQGKNKGQVYDLE